MTIKTTYYTILFSSVLFLSSCSKKEKLVAETVDTDTVASVVMRPSNVKFEKLSAEYIADKKYAIDRFYHKNWPAQTNNVSFLVAKDGQILYEKYDGLSNLRKKTPITAETPIHIASVSKVLTATTVLKLVQVGKIKLDQKVNTILSNFPYPEITIRNLLSHRTGMRNYAYFTNKKEIWDQHKTLTNQDIVDVINDKNIDLEYRTDSRFGYCNTNYAILALIIEKVTGQTYKEAMKTIIFDPLGMKNTFVYDYKKDQDSVTLSYKCNGLQIGWDYLDGVYGDKNIYSTPRDLLKFNMATNAPDFLTPELRKQIYKGYSNERKGTKNYGLGIRMINWATGQNFYFHNGWWHGNMSSYVTLKKENVMIIALSNKCSKQVYKVRNLAPLFGDYPFKIDKTDRDE
ncbi:serine hydrolase [Flavobacterium sp. GT3R68]|uniref:serine hydrolase domain-containing protein n=1 Tax=Flavobacterium sp. GT3R68 TaxID=2594437 RepID=UPI000F86A71E|nr:serine hydrolase domain-containing protein [Flavobacterium sp. GT3R68]RTY89097.1 class A beta-lactamase-related serine hydrolase [Flavobacterium sp. GSN2]TRW90105.1 beta-lactamase family protein [Flavobacterium sp. GT3R68]